MTELSLPPLNILHLASSERWTGVAEPLVSLALQQVKRGHRVRVGCVPGGTFESETRARGLETLDGLHLNRRMAPLQFLSDFRLLPRYCRENRVDVVHCHILHDHWLAAMSLKGIFRIRHEGAPLLIRTLHSSGVPRADWWHRRLFSRYSDGVVCISRHGARNIETALGMAEGSVPHVAGGVNLEKFHPENDGAEIRKELGIPLEDPMIGIVSRVRAGRGVRWLMRSFPAVLEKLPNAHLVVFGRGELKKWFRKEMKAPIYKGRAHNGFYRTDDLADAYAAMDATLFLGLGSEGTCRAILEAMASGRPTIGANVGAVSEIIEDGKTGLLVRNRDAGDLAEKIVEVLSDPKRRQAMGRAARERAAQFFTEETRAEGFEKIYARLLK